MKNAMKVTVIALLAFVMLFAVACNSEEGDNSAVATPKPGTQTSQQGGNYITEGAYSFYSWQYTTDSPYSGDDERSAQMRQRVSDMQEKYGITIEFASTSSYQTGALLQAAFQGKPLITGMKEGGLHTMMSTYLYNDVPGTCLEPLSDHKQVYNLDDENKFNVYSQYDLCEYNDKLWYFIPIEIGVHFECGGNAMVFNKQLLAANGYSAEDIYKMVDDGTWTWAELEKVLTACTDTSAGIWGMERGNEALVMWSLANSNGTEFVECKTGEDGSKFDSFVYQGDKGERLMQAYDEFLKLANDLKVMETTYYGSTDASPLKHFLSGTVAFYYNGYSTNALKLIADASFDYGLVPWPKGPANVANENTYHSFYPHLNPYCVFRGQENPDAAVQVLCELYTPIYDADSEDALSLYNDEKTTFTRDTQSQKYLDIVESSKTHFRVFMYANAPCTVGESKSVSGALFGTGEDALLDQSESAKTYFEKIANVINQAIYERSPYTWK